MFYVPGWPGRPALFSSSSTVETLQGGAALAVWMSREKSFGKDSLQRALPSAGLMLGFNSALSFFRSTEVVFET